MTPLPGGLGSKEFVAWRLDQDIHKDAWDSGIGSFRAGGRWNSKGKGYVVYCAIDPATAILEVAVHKGMRTLDTVKHVLTSLSVDQSIISKIHVVQPDAVPNPNWLRPGVPSMGQQAYGDDLLSKHAFILAPSVVSIHSWNLIFDRNKAASLYVGRSQEVFALDTRLHPQAP